MIKVTHTQKVTQTSSVSAHSDLSWRAVISAKPRAHLDRFQPRLECTHSLTHSQKLMAITIKVLPTKRKSDNFGTKLFLVSVYFRRFLKQKMKTTTAIIFRRYLLVRNSGETAEMSK